MKFLKYTNLCWIEFVSQEFEIINIFLIDTYICFLKINISTICKIKIIVFKIIIYIFEYLFKVKDSINRYNVTNIIRERSLRKVTLMRCWLWWKSRGRRIEVEPRMKKWLDNLNKNSMLFLNRFATLASYLALTRNARWVKFLSHRIASLSAYISFAERMRGVFILSVWFRFS